MLESYIKEIEADLKLDELNLKQYQLKLPTLKHKWAGRCTRHKLELINLKKLRDKIKVKISKEIVDKSPVTLSSVVADRTAEKHSELIEHDATVKELELVIELLEKAEKTFSSYSYDISNLIKIIQLETT